MISRIATGFSSDGSVKVRIPGEDIEGYYVKLVDKSAAVPFAAAINRAAATALAFAGMSLDYKTALEIQKEVGPTLDHHPRCSSVPGWHPISGPGLLCDCGAVEREWERRIGLALAAARRRPPRVAAGRGEGGRL